MIERARTLVKATPRLWVFEFPSGDIVVECRVCGWSILIDSANEKDAIRLFRRHWAITHLNGSKW